MRWPWQKTIVQRAAENHATLTILPDGSMVLGVPHGTTPSRVDEITQVLKRLYANPNESIVFPFPVDVIDHRDTRRKHLETHGYPDV